ncbi:hypothetical protein KIL84_014211 [Mauremys mutica]|uniref:Uncharacterized protein n=1 Tax=Mauremys mutica TaxID=74926 RepID=A0A9D3XQY2_9SAUR|nr:hypothetical protein KIL84_014211 [Mauremys mutica]
MQFMHRPFFTGLHFPISWWIKSSIVPTSCQLLELHLPDSGSEPSPQGQGRELLAWEQMSAAARMLPEAALTFSRRMCAVGTMASPRQCSSSSSSRTDHSSQAGCPSLSLYAI